MRQNLKYLTLRETNEQRLKRCVLLKTEQIKQEGKQVEIMGEIEKDGNVFFQVLAISDSAKKKRKGKSNER